LILFVPSVTIPDRNPVWFLVSSVRLTMRVREQPIEAREPAATV
jgi:hypothetical protein